MGAEIFGPMGLRMPAMPDYSMREAGAALLSYFGRLPPRPLGDHLRLNGHTGEGLEEKEMRWQGTHPTSEIASMIWRVMFAKLPPGVQEAFNLAASLPLGERLPPPRRPAPAFVPVTIPAREPGKRRLRLAPLSLVVLHELEAGARPASEYHTGTVNHLRRHGLVAVALRMSPYPGRPEPVSHLVLTPAGAAALERGRDALSPA